MQDGKRFIDVLRHLLASGQVEVMGKNDAQTESDAGAEQIVGREAEGGGVYLFPVPARRAVERFGQLNADGSELYTQLDNLGYIGRQDEDGLVQAQIGTVYVRVLHLSASAWEDLQGKDDAWTPGESRR
ncbi:MAG: hypothetical protein KF753_18305 [Caldilineaceae bacterium]|nr:hypothetical protein [Caldilineaceae bacterium]